MIFKTAKKFYDFCVQHEACQEGLAEIKGLTLADWWDKTKRGDYMLWLREKGVWTFPEPINAKYGAALAPIYEKYLADLAIINAKYEADLATIDAKYESYHATLIRSLVGNPFREVKP